MDPRVWQLVARKVSNEATLEELRELEQLCQDDPELRYRIELYIKYFDQPQQATRSAAEKKASWNRFQGKLSQEYPIATRKYSFIKYTVAASLLIAVSVAVFYFGHSNSQQLVGKQPVDEVNTMPGTRSKMVLPDGTTVWLNSESHLSYNSEFGKTKREITLTGEGFFDVAHNEKVPMILRAGEVNILVKGTAFNVRNYPDARGVETSLIRGSIELSTNGEPGKKILLKPNQKIIIAKTPGVAETSQIFKPKEDNYRIEALHESSLSHTIPEISWVENKLVFDNERFSDVISRMEKWYNLEIELQNQELGAKQFSGSFEKEGINEALSALQIIYHFNYEIKGSKIIIK